MNLFKVNNNGIISLDYENIDNEIKNSFKKSFSNDLNLDISTPQGQIIAILVALTNEYQTHLVKLLNSFNPYTAEQSALDNTGAFFGYYRKNNIPTLVICKLIGKENLKLPSPLIVSDKDESNKYECLDELTIGPDGYVYGEFICKTNGAIKCPKGTINKIITNINGLDSVINEKDGIIGRDVETDNEFRNRITSNWLNIRAKSTLGSIIDSINSLNGVISVIARENYDENEKEIDGLKLKPHSIWLTVLGGNSKEIAKILTEKKTLGCGTNGNTAISYHDDITGYNYRYNIERPEFIDIKIQINYGKNNYTPALIDEKVKNLIMDYVKEHPFKIGATITGAELGLIFKNYNEINLYSIKVALNNDTYRDYVKTNLKQVFYLQRDNIILNEIKV